MVSVQNCSTRRSTLFPRWRIAILCIQCMSFRNEEHKISGLSLAQCNAWDHMAVGSLEFWQIYVRARLLDKAQIIFEIHVFAFHGSQLHLYAASICARRSLRLIIFAWFWLVSTRHEAILLILWFWVLKRKAWVQDPGSDAVNCAHTILNQLTSVLSRVDNSVSEWTALCSLFVSMLLRCFQSLNKFSFLCFIDALLYLIRIRWTLVKCYEWSSLIPSTLIPHPQFADILGCWVCMQTINTWNPGSNTINRAHPILKPVVKFVFLHWQSV